MSGARPAELTAETGGATAGMAGWTILLPLLLHQIGLGECLKLLELSVPTHKLVGEGVKLVCKFDMEGDTLYSVKWYRNEQEFYRFVPNDRPKLQIFPQQGIRVERAKSSRQHVYLFDLQLEASGTYRCEVSAEAPSFRTKHEEKVMVVVQPPHTNEITGLQPSYHVGDLVNVTCYSRGSSPPAELAWKVNNEQIEDSRSRRYGGEIRESYPAEFYSVGERGAGRDFSVGEPRPAPPRGLPGTIRDWFDKQQPDSPLDSAASNLQFRVVERHRLAGLSLQCTAAIGAEYWHSTPASAEVTDRRSDYSWGLGLASTAAPPCFPASPLLASLVLGCALLQASAV